MTEKLFLDQKTNDQLKAEYYELLSRILDLWLKIPPGESPNKQQELELSILEGIATSYQRVMKDRKVYVISMVVPNE